MRVQRKEVPRWVLVVGGLGLAGGLYLLTRKKEAPLPETPPPPEVPPITGIPEIDPILYEIDKAIAKLREIIEFLRESVEGADELIKANEAVITDAQNIINEIKSKVANKTVTQQDAEKLLMVLEKVVNQFTIANAFLIMLVKNVNTAIQELEDTVSNLEKQINDLKYQLEPVPVSAASQLCGISETRMEVHSAAFVLSMPQEITIKGLISAQGFYGCTNAAAYIYNRSGEIIKSWTVKSCCAAPEPRYKQTQVIDEKVQLVQGVYILQTKLWGPGGVTSRFNPCGLAEANAQIDYQTARFLVE